MLKADIIGMFHECDSGVFIISLKNIFEVCESIYILSLYISGLYIAVKESVTESAFNKSSGVYCK